MPTKPRPADAGKLNNSSQYRAPHPGASRVPPAVGINAAARAVTDIRGDRIGSYCRVFERYLAVDRLGRPIGQFETEQAAYDAISAVAGGGR